MSEPKLTPGPWFYQEDADVYTHIIRPLNSCGTIIASCPQSTSPCVKADAHLIAAAPDLYEALKELRNSFNMTRLLMDEESRQIAADIIDNVDKILAKAEGQS